MDSLHVGRHPDKRRKLNFELLYSRLLILI